MLRFIVKKTGDDCPSRLKDSHGLRLRDCVPRSALQIPRGTFGSCSHKWNCKLLVIGQTAQSAKNAYPFNRQRDYQLP